MQTPSFAISPLTRSLAHVCGGIAQTHEKFKVGSNPVRVVFLGDKGYAPIDQVCLCVSRRVKDSSKAGSRRERTRINKDRTAGIEPRCDFVTGYALYRQRENAGGTASGLPQVLLPVQPEGEGVTAVTVVAASDVFCGRQVTDLESFLLFFLFHFILLSNLVLPSVNFHLENSFLAVH